MALVSRLVGRQACTKFLQTNIKTGFYNFVRPVKIDIRPFQPKVEAGHDARNAQFSRPQSPHLSIYKFQLTMALSISHRITGIIMSGYLMSLGFGALILSHPISQYIDMLAAAQIGSFPILFVKFCLGYPMVYHFWNGIRHLMWDLGKFLTIKEVYSTGYTVIGMTIISTIGLLIL